MSRDFFGIHRIFVVSFCSFVSLRIVRYSCFCAACGCTAGLEPLLIGVLFCCIFPTKNGVSARVSPELGHYFMVRRELIQAFLEKLDVFLVSWDALTLHPVVLYLRLNQAHCHLIVFRVLRKTERRDNQEHLIVRVHFLVISLLHYVFG